MNLLILYYIYISVPKHTGPFYLDVEKKLNKLIKNKGSLKTNSFSPYGYKLDFEINLKSSEKTKDPFKNEKYNYIFKYLNYY